MYVWLENVNSESFEVCIREFLPFEGKHEDTIVVSNSFFFLFSIDLIWCVRHPKTLHYSKNATYFKTSGILDLQTLGSMLLLLMYFYCFFKNEGAAPKMVPNMRKKTKKERNLEENYHKIQIRTEKELRLN